MMHKNIQMGFFLKSVEIRINNRFSLMLTKAPNGLETVTLTFEL